jgi:predicted esterase YcpF (UPF0227 family)
MDDQDLLKIIAKERYELELMAIELKRLVELVHWNKEHPIQDFMLQRYNDETLDIKIKIQNLKMDLQRLDIDHLNHKLHNISLKR